jgi:uncharacterized protein
VGVVHVPADRRLRKAIRSGDLDGVVAALADGADPNRRLSFTTPIALAACCGLTDIVELLFRQGADVGWTREDGWPPATFADASGHRELGGRLVELGARPTSIEAHGYTALHRAAGSGDADAVVSWLAEINVDARDAAGATALMHALDRRRDDAAKALLAAGADPNQEDFDGWAPLNMAAYIDSQPSAVTDFVTMLVNAGADPNRPSHPTLFSTVNQEWASAGVFARLLALGADISRRGPDSDSALHRIAWYGDEALVDIAVDAGADLEARNAHGRTPLDEAVEGDNDRTYRRLLERGAEQTENATADPTATE